MVSPWLIGRWIPDVPHDGRDTKGWAVCGGQERYSDKDFEAIGPRCNEPENMGQ